MATIEASGSQLTVITTEHTLATSSGAASFVLVLDLSPMQAGDTLEVRCKRKVLAGSVIRTVYLATFVDAQPTDDLIKISVPMPSTIQAQWSIKQTAGSPRTFDWSLESV